MTFRFVTFADSRGGYDTLAAISNSAVALNPSFAIFPGDLCNSFDVNCINNTWKPAMNGNSGNGLLDRSFVSRGNHDAGTLITWQGLWDFARVANIIGVTNYTEETYNATYSFDYENSHFVVIDLPGGGVNTLSPLIGVPSLSAAQVSWLDSDLTDAEARTEIQNIFLFWHGPVYTATSAHGSEAPSSSLVNVFNNHPKIRAGFFGHEHITIYAHLDSSRVSGLTHEFEEFTIGRAGAPVYSVSKPVDYDADSDGFAAVDVDANGYTVNIYDVLGTLLFTKKFAQCPPIKCTLTFN